MSTGARDIDTKAAREVLVKMTPGQWYTLECWPGHWSLNSSKFEGEGNRIFDCNELDRHGEAKQADAYGIAFLRNNAAAWLDEIDRLTAHADAAVAAERELLIELVRSKLKWAHERQTKNEYDEGVALGEVSAFRSVIAAIKVRTPPPDLTEQGEG